MLLLYKFDLDEMSSEQQTLIDLAMGYEDDTIALDLIRAGFKLDRSETTLPVEKTILYRAI